MVQITEELIRKRAEHNECIIGTLEELSLHQEDICKIEHINNWCKDLQILYLQANLISKIENLNKLKKLQYLNLAVNNIEKIENLERCESLEKLDLTLNFIGDLESVASLQNNVHLKHLYLTGNPCCEYKGYRDYVVAQLPQLITLDQTEITPSERIVAQQKLVYTELDIIDHQEKYAKFREDQINRQNEKNTAELSDEDFWKSSSEHSPESRVEIANRSRRAKVSKGCNRKEELAKKQIRLFSKTGVPLNINQAKLPFSFSDADPKEYVLDINVYKYLDTSLINVDLQPIYVNVTVKGKVFQMVFPDEIYVDNSKAQRSMTTGHLVLTMPRVGYRPVVKASKNKKKSITKSPEKCIKDKKDTYLEVKDADKSMDFSKIIENNQRVEKSLQTMEVPPLEYGF